MFSEVFYQRGVTFRRSSLAKWEVPVVETFDVHNLLDVRKPVNNVLPVVHLRGVVNASKVQVARNFNFRYVVSRWRAGAVNFLIFFIAKIELPRFSALYALAAVQQVFKGRS